MNHKVFFNHIPKTAGTTLISIFDRNYKVDRIMPPMPGMAWQKLIDKDLKIDIEKYDFIRSHTNLNDLLTDEWKTVTFLRDPLRRLLSLHNHWRTWTDQEIDSAGTPDDIKDIKKKIRDLSLVEVLRLDHPYVQFEFTNGMTKHLLADHSFEEMNKMSNEELYAQGKKSIDKFFFVGIVEKFYESMFVLCMQCNFIFDDKIQNLNERKYDLAQDWTLEERKIIDDAVYVDQKVYEYGLSLFNERYSRLLVQSINKRSGNAIPFLCKEKRKIYHVHIPKTAGTTTNKILDGFYRSQDIWPDPLIDYLKMVTGVEKYPHTNEFKELEQSPVYKRKLSRIRELVKGQTLKRVLDLPFENIFNYFYLYHLHSNYSNLISKDWKKIIFFREPELRLKSHFYDWKTLKDSTIDESLDRPELKDLKRLAKKSSFFEFFKIKSTLLEDNFQNVYFYYLLGNENVKLRRTANEEVLCDDVIARLGSFLLVGIVEEYFNSIALLHYKMKWLFDPSYESLNVREYSKDHFDPGVGDKWGVDRFINYDKKIYNEARRRFNSDFAAMLKSIADENSKNDLLGSNQANDGSIIGKMGRVLTARLETPQIPALGTFYINDELLRNNGSFKYVAWRIKEFLKHMAWRIKDFF